jgi:hypothetical protein
MLEAIRSDDLVKQIAVLGYMKELNKWHESFFSTMKRFWADIFPYIQFSPSDLHTMTQKRYIKSLEFMAEVKVVNQSSDYITSLNGELESRVKSNLT